MKFKIEDKIKYINQIVILPTPTVYFLENGMDLYTKVLLINIKNNLKIRRYKINNINRYDI